MLEEEKELLEERVRELTIQLEKAEKKVLSTCGAVTSALVVGVPAFTPTLSLLTSPVACCTCS